MKVRDDCSFAWGDLAGQLGNLDMASDSDDSDSDDGGGEPGGAQQGVAAVAAAGAGAGAPRGGAPGFRLTNCDFAVATGALVAVVGRVGSGKTSLLHALLGEMDCEGAPVEIRGRVAYAAQSPFILNATTAECETHKRRFRAVPA